MVKFFVKGGKVHKYPKETECPIDWDGEELCDEPPKETEKCGFCFDFQQ